MYSDRKHAHKRTKSERPSSFQDLNSLGVGLLHVIFLMFNPFSSALSHFQKAEWLIDIYDCDNHSSGGSSMSS